MLDVRLNAPVLFVPERYQAEGIVLVVDLGSIKVDSTLIEFDPEKNYKLVNNPVLLYDAYNFH
jgi:molecular chaperone DnaK (HSP70)